MNSSLQDRKWDYQIGGRPQGLIPCLILLLTFGGVTAYLFTIHHGAILFTLLMTLIVLVLLVLVIYRALFVKLLIGETGFYHQTKPGNGRFLPYSQIRNAWESAGLEVGGNPGYFCAYETQTGQVVRFSFLPYESDAVDCFVARCTDPNRKLEEVDPSQQEYLIDGKPFSGVGIVAMVVFLVLLASMALPTLSLMGPSVLLTFAPGFLLILGVLVWQGIHRRFFQVRIGVDGFYVRTNPFNGRYYAYTDIASCEEIRKVYRHNRRLQSDGHSPRTLYYHYFVFTDRQGHTSRFLFQKSLSGFEVRVLQERIERANGRPVPPEETDEELI